MTELRTPSPVVPWVGTGALLLVLRREDLSRNGLVKSSASTHSVLWTGLPRWLGRKVQPPSNGGPPLELACGISSCPSRCFTQSPELIEEPQFPERIRERLLRRLYPFLRREGRLQQRCACFFHTVPSAHSYSAAPILPPCAPHKSFCYIFILLITESQCLVSK